MRLGCACSPSLDSFSLADPSRPYANFFGDEELFKNRTVWLRNVSMGIPISPADTIYVFDEVGRSSYLYLLAYIQALVGDAPYGTNVLNACWYVAAVLLLHGFIRRAYGRVAAFGGADAAAVSTEPVQLVDLGAEGAALHAAGRG